MSEEGRTAAGTTKRLEVIWKVDRGSASLDMPPGGEEASPSQASASLDTNKSF